MKLTCKEIGLYINVDDKLLDSLVTIGKSYYPNEFGGFLVGNYSEDNKELNIVDTILPKKYKATKYAFEREIDGIKMKLLKLYNEEQKKYYVGEWHTHPDNLPIPSDTDINAINKIINDSNVVIKNPVFLIIGYNKTKVEFGFYVPFKNKLYRYEQ